MSILVTNTAYQTPMYFQVAFRPGAVDLPAGQLMATTHAITMSEKDLATGDLSMIDFEQFVDFAAYVVFFLYWCPYVAISRSHVVQNWTRLSENGYTDKHIGLTRLAYQKFYFSIIS